MSRLLWLIADRISHKIPWPHFGLIRHAICIRHLEAEYPDEEWR